MPRFLKLIDQCSPGRYRIFGAAGSEWDGGDASALQGVLHHRRDHRPHAVLWWRVRRGLLSGKRKLNCSLKLTFLCSHYDDDNDHATIDVRWNKCQRNTKKKYDERNTKWNTMKEIPQAEIGRRCVLFHHAISLNDVIVAQLWLVDMASNVVHTRSHSIQAAGMGTWWDGKIFKWRNCYYAPIGGYGLIRSSYKIPLFAADAEGGETFNLSLVSVIKLSYARCEAPRIFSCAARKYSEANLRCTG